MNIYFAFTLFLVFSFLITFDNKNLLMLKKVTVYYLIFFMLLLSGFRYFTGTDYHNYWNIFYDDRPAEKGYYFFSHLFKDFSLFLIIFSFVSIIIKYRFVQKELNDVLLFLVLYCLNIFLPFDMGAIRNGFAIGIVFYSTRSILSKNLFSFIIYIMVASLFHTTAIIFFPVYFLYQSKYLRSPIFLLTLVFLSIILGKTNFLFEVLLNILERFSNVNFLIIKKMMIYLSLKVEIFSPSYITNFTMIIIFSYYRLKTNDEKYSLYYFCVMFGYILMFLSVKIPDIAIRIPSFFDIYKYFLLLIIVKNKRKFKEILLLFLFLSMGLLKYFSHINKWYDYFIPFKSILSLF